jgi:hypothetical protein
MREWQHDGLDTGEERQVIGGGDKRIVINTALSRQPMNKVSGANVRRLLNLFLLKARFKGCFFACVGDYPPRFDE